MPWKFNPFSNTLDQTGSGGGGGASYLDGEVQNFSALPQTVGSPAVDSAYLCREPEGAWLLSRKPAGIYIRTANTGVRASDWTYAGEFPDVFSDDKFVLYDETDSSKNMVFQLSGITTGTTRTISVPNKNVTLDDAGDSRTPSSHASSHASAGSDPLAPSDIGAAASNHTHILATDIATALAEDPDLCRDSLNLGDMATEPSGNFSTAGHGHGNITSDGKIGSTSGLPVVTTTGGAVTTLALGAAGTVLTVNSGANGVEFAAASGGGSGGTKTYAVFTAEHNQPPSTAFATLDTRNSIAVLDFDAATDENAVFVGIMPEAASLGSGLIVRLHWMATSATSGNVRWGVQFERSNTDLDADSFAAAVEANGAANGTSGILTTTAITVTDFDGITAGDVFRLKVFRNADDATNDTMTGDAELVAVEVRSAA